MRNAFKGASVVQLLQLQITKKLTFQYIGPTMSEVVLNHTIL